MASSNCDTTSGGVKIAANIVGNIVRTGANCAAKTAATGGVRAN